MEARKEVDHEYFTSYIMNELSSVEIGRAEIFLESYWQTDTYRDLKEKVMTQPATLSSEELICFVLARDGEEAPYEIPLARLQQVIEEKKDVLTPHTLRHLTIIHNVLAQEWNHDDLARKELERLLIERARGNDKAFFLNLAKVNLSDVNLLATFLQGVYLVRANLQKTTFFSYNDSNMSYADLRDTQFLHDSASGMNLHGANLAGAQIGALEWTNVDLSHANLTNAHLEFAKLINVNLRMAIFNNTNLSGTKFNKALFFSQHNSLESLEAELVQIMQSVVNCATWYDAKSMDSSRDAKDLYNIKIFHKLDDSVYVAIAEHLVETLQTMDQVSDADKRDFLTRVSPRFGASAESGLSLWSAPRIKSLEVLNVAKNKLYVDEVRKECSLQ